MLVAPGKFVAIITSSLFSLQHQHHRITLPEHRTVFKIIEPGFGPAVSVGARVTVHAIGVITESGRLFWSTTAAGQEPYTFRAGVGEVIEGWDKVWPPPCLFMGCGRFDERSDRAVLACCWVKPDSLKSRRMKHLVRRETSQCVYRHTLRWYSRLRFARAVDLMKHPSHPLSAAQ